MVVTELRIEQIGFVGEFWAAPTNGPAVMVISGSRGGHPGAEYGPALLAEGFSVLALTYFWRSRPAG